MGHPESVRLHRVARPVVVRPDEVVVEIAHFSAPHRARGFQRSGRVRVLLVAPVRARARVAVGEARARALLCGAAEP